MMAPDAAKIRAASLLVDETLDARERGAGAVRGTGAAAFAALGCTYRETWRTRSGAHLPDVMVLDLLGTATPAFAAIEAVMAETPHADPGAPRSGAGSRRSVPALALGALDVAEAPAASAAGVLADLAAQAGAARAGAGGAARPGQARTKMPEAAIGRSSPGVSRWWRSPRRSAGPKALSVAAAHACRKDFRRPICICQHISDGFTDGLAQWLSWQTHARAWWRPGRRSSCKPGTVYIAPVRQHLLRRPRRQARARRRARR